jgi:uncharacterized repeat protein (TIGR02543 family)
MISLLLMLGMLAGIFPAAMKSADAAPTTSITVTKYGPDGTTILGQRTLSYTEMETLLPIQGDGTTKYYMQGPTFVPANLWDPGETINLKNKGAVKGTDVKDLCDIVGGAVAGDQIQIKAVDGYGERFTYEDVYNPELEQGKFVICWYTKNAGDTETLLYPDGAYVPAFADGMQLVFMSDNTTAAGKHVFGHQDMHDYIAEENWHWYYQDGINYPSANGLSIKYISEINIYQEPVPQWTINVTGIVNMAVDQGWFENALACHETANWTDSSSNIWSGLPLWYLCGLADDTNTHGMGAFNDAVAEAGYTVEVRATPDFAKTFASAAVARNSGYIVANLKNGAPLSEADGYPLKLVGSAITSGSNRVKNITSINLLDVPVLETWTFELVGASNYTMTQAEFASCVACHGAQEYVDPVAGTYSGIPLWLLAGWVDDDIQHGPGAFNDALATTPPGYQVKVIAVDDYYFAFDSADVARNNGIIVANKLNGEDLPDGEYPIRLIGDGFAGGSGWKVREISKIELNNLPASSYSLNVSTVGSGTVTKNPDQATYTAGTPVQLTANPVAGWDFTGWSGDLTGTANPATVTMDGNKTITATFAAQQWNLQLNGMTKLTISKADFEAAAAANPVSCVVTNKDGTQDTYSGVAFWRLVGKVDDGDPATMNSVYAAKNYNIESIASDNFTKSITSTQVYGNDTILMANKMNGNELPSDKYPLRLVGQGTTSGWMVSKVITVQFTIPWDIQLIGNLTTTMTNMQFESAATANPASWAETSSNTWSGTALWRLVALVDDADPATFNDAFAAAGYSIKITASDGFNKTFASADIARNESRTFASKYNSYWLPPNQFPLRFVGPGLSSGQMVSKIVKIELLNLPKVITATAGANGSISPSGSVAVALNADKTFTITPDIGYHVAGVLVDGASVGAVNSYTFTGVIADHTISASFAIETFTITASAGANGSINPSGNVAVNYGADQTFTITPNAGCQIVDVLVDGVSAGAVGSYTFTSVKSAHKIYASFVKLLKKFSIDWMYIDYQRQDNRDTIYMNAKVAMPDGVSFNPATDAVNLNIDGFVINIPAGSFKVMGQFSQIYTYWTKGYTSPYITMTLNLKKGELTLMVLWVNADVINNYDGIVITLIIGPVIGVQNINMFVDSLSYPANR